MASNISICSNEQCPKVQIFLKLARNSFTCRMFQNGSERLKVGNFAQIPLPTWGWHGLRAVYVLM
jgi:hypothetical protein